MSKYSIYIHQYEQLTPQEQVLRMWTNMDEFLKVELEVPDLDEKKCNCEKHK